MATTVKSKSTYANLSAINVRGKVERKGQMDYLSWANAWHMLKREYPNATRTVYEDEATGWNYFTDGRSAWVKVGITVNDMEHIDYLPVMDFRNNALPIDKVSATDVNKTIQRSTAKAIAMHGLGLKLWTGEDYPEPQVETVSSKTLKVNDVNYKKIVAYMKENKDKTIDDILAMAEKKYKVTATVKKGLTQEIAKR